MEGLSSSHGETSLEPYSVSASSLSGLAGQRPARRAGDAGEEGGERGAWRGGRSWARRGGRAMAAGLEEAFGAAGEFGGAQRRLTALLVLLQVGSRRVGASLPPGGPAAAGRSLGPPCGFRLAEFVCFPFPYLRVFGFHFLKGVSSWPGSEVGAVRISCLERSERRSSAGAGRKALGAGCCLRRARGWRVRAWGWATRADRGLRCRVNGNCCRVWGSAEREPFC